MNLHEDEKHWTEVCKLGKGAECCKYLVAGASGLECIKETPQYKRILDENWGKHLHTSQGDNCEGYFEYKKNSEKRFDKRYDEPFEDDGAYAD